MESYKRNQIEEAISRVFGEKSAKPSSELQTRIKRLLDLDRSLPRNTRSIRPELANYAFYSSDSPGKGTEVSFSKYEAFALMIGLQMLNHNWPQKFVVDTLRRFPARTPKATQENSESSIPRSCSIRSKSRLHAQSGSLAVNTDSAIFLLIWSDQRQANDPTPSAGIFNQQGAFAVLMDKVGRSSTWLELTRPAHSLLAQLSASLPRKRGRN